MVTSVKRLLVGSPPRTERAAHERLSKKSALRGDKLVFSNGIVILALFSSVLVSVPYHLEH